MSLSEFQSPKTEFQRRFRSSNPQKQTSNVVFGVPIPKNRDPMSLSEFQSPKTEFQCRFQGSNPQKQTSNPQKQSFNPKK